MKSLIFTVVFSLLFVVHSFAQHDYDTVADAAGKIDQEVAVSGRIVGTHYTGIAKGDLVFINLDYAYPNNPITIIIAADYRLNFPIMQDLENKTVVIKGLLKKNKSGKPTIFLEEEHQLVVLDEIAK